jgi:hypothetical protein
MTSPQQAQAWDALKQLGDAALEHGGIQGVLQMFISALTSAEQVARESEEAGDAEDQTPEVIAKWLATGYAPALLAEMSGQAQKD